MSDGAAVAAAGAAAVAQATKASGVIVRLRRFAQRFGIADHLAGPGRLVVACGLGRRAIARLDARLNARDRLELCERALHDSLMTPACEAAALAHRPRPTGHPPADSESCCLRVNAMRSSGSVPRLRSRLGRGRDHSPA